MLDHVRVEPTPILEVPKAAKKARAAGVEQKFETEITNLEGHVTTMVVNTTEDYEKAADLAKSVKQMKKNVTDYWEPVRVATKNAYDEVLARKKAMLTPLDTAERLLKSKMSAFVAEAERKEKQREAELRRLAAEEMDKKLEEAAEAEKNGDEVGVEFAMTQAEIMQEAATTILPKKNVSTPKVSGVSTSKAWRITSIDNSKVPTKIMGTMIRPVDEKAVMALIKASKGTIEIPGIEYEETVSISVRT